MQDLWLGKRDAGGNNEVSQVKGAFNSVKTAMNTHDLKESIGFNTQEHPDTQKGQACARYCASQK